MSQKSGSRLVVILLAAGVIVALLALKFRQLEPLPQPGSPSPSTLLR